MVEFYRSNNNYQRTFDSIQASETISSANKKLATEFLRHLLARETPPGRIKKYMEKFKGLCGMTKKRLAELQIRDIENLKIEVNKFPSIHTRKDYNITLKLLLRMIHKENYNPEAYRGLLKTTYRESNELSLNASDLLTDEELSKIISVSKPMFKALISLQNENGMRPSELLSLTIGSLQFKETFTEVSIRQSKTVKRLNYANVSDSYLREWYNQHPRKNDPNAPLFPSYYRGIEHMDFLTPPGYATALRMFAKRAGIAKRVYPYLIRHTAITRMLRDGWTIQMIQSLVGHTIGSNTIRKYSHLADEDVKKYVLEKTIEKENKSISEGKELGYLLCNFCKTRNVPEAYYCSSCNRPVNMKALIEIEQRKARFDDFIMDFIQRAAASDPKLRDIALQSAREKGIADSWNNVKR